MNLDLLVFRLSIAWLAILIGGLTYILLLVL
jgi:hypothetical protein